jgi:hypothetical protein
MTLNTDGHAFDPRRPRGDIDRPPIPAVVRLHSVETVVNNATFLAEGASIFNVPTLFTTAFAERQAMFAELQAVQVVSCSSSAALPGSVLRRSHMLSACWCMRQAWPI